MPIPQEVKDNPSNFFRNPAGQIKKRGGGVVYDPASEGGGGDDGGGGGATQSPFQAAPNVAPEAFLNTTDFLKLARIQAEGTIAPFSPDIPKLRDLAEGNVKPSFDVFRGALDKQQSIAQQQTALTQGKIIRNFDDAFEQLQESYNDRGLFFSGEELDAEGRHFTSRAETLSQSDLQLQEVLNNIETQRGQLTINEKKEIESMFQNLLTSDESVFNKQKEEQVNRILASVIPGFVQSKGQLEQFKLQSETTSRQLRDALNLQSFNINEQTAPLDLALKLAKVENIPIEQAQKLSDLAIKEAQINRIPIEDALKVAQLDLKQADVANIPLQRQLLETKVQSALHKLSLGVDSNDTTSNLAEGLLLGILSPEKLYSSAANAKVADEVIKTAFVLAQEKVGQSFPFSIFEEELKNINAGFGSDFLNLPPDVRQPS